VTADPAAGVANLGHAQVHVGRELAVKLDLARARRRAGRHRAEIEEPRLTGFFSLQARSPTKNTDAECVSVTPAYGSAIELGHSL
jgi:hypothetical protein